ncbi:MAG: tetratricopeptide repeat-containing sensor histidine kinase [Tenuifilaceae bacterium]|jgi:signal transduction histidine kinase|nr:tetratricopeptide repeat-containing sensor histidine kinase [Tenuifilaceae bacterium]
MMRIISLKLIRVIILPLLFVYGNYSYGQDLKLQPSGKEIQRIDSLNALAYEYRRSDPKLSLEYAIESHRLSTSIGYAKGLGESYHNMGTAKAVFGWYDKGLIDLIESARIRESDQDTDGLVSTYNNIGYIYSELKNDDKALDFYEKAFALINYSNSPRIVGIIINNIGHVNFRKKNYDRALEFFYQAYEHNKRNNDQRGESNSLSNIGLVYHIRGDYAKGLEYHLQAYELGRNLNDKFGLVNTLRNISESYLKLNRDVDATNYALRSLLLAQELNSIAEELNTSGLLARIYEKRGRFKEAANYYKIESTLKDSLFNIQNSEAIGKIQAAYEIDNQIKENEFLRKEQNVNFQKIRIQRISLILSVLLLFLVIVLMVFIILANRRIKQAVEQLTRKNEEATEQKETIQQKVKALDEKNSELQSSNSIKNKLISVIAHDLKNPFNSISGYSELLVSNFREYTNDEVENFLGIIHDSAIKGNMLLDNLLQWSRLQTSSIQFLPVEHPLYRIVNDELFFATQKAKEKNIEILNEIQEDLVVYADSNMLKTVIRNLVSNALKFTPEGGTICIVAKKEVASLLISVSDSGMGIEPHIKEKLFTGEAGVTTASTSGEKGTGLGLMICRDFIKKHGGEIWVESKPGHGATFFFRLPNKA